MKIYRQAPQHVIFNVLNFKIKIMRFNVVQKLHNTTF